MIRNNVTAKTHVFAATGCKSLKFSPQLAGNVAIGEFSFCSPAACRRALGAMETTSGRMNGVADNDRKS
jgi:hypothetical protein